MQKAYLGDIDFCIQLYRHFDVVYGKKVKILDNIPTHCLKKIDVDLNLTIDCLYFEPKISNSQHGRFLIEISRNFHGCTYSQENSIWKYTGLQITIYPFSDNNMLFNNVPILKTFCNNGRNVDFNNQEIIFHLSMLNKKTLDNFIFKLLFVTFILENSNLPLELRFTICKFIPFFNKIHHHYQFKY